MSGVQQGDPLVPLYFCCGITPIVEIIESMMPLYNKWVAPPEVLVKVWGVLNTLGPDLGLFLNPAKCEWSWLDPSRTSLCPIEGVPLVPTDEICMLGVPLGSSPFSGDFVERELLSCAKVLDQLSTFEDTQVAMYLLRLSYSVVRANHFMRTTPLGDWGSQAVKFDEMVRETAEVILGVKFTPTSYTQACLSPRWSCSRSCFRCFCRQ